MNLITKLWRLSYGVFFVVVVKLKALKLLFSRKAINYGEKLLGAHNQAKASLRCTAQVRPNFVHMLLVHAPYCNKWLKP